MMRQWPLRAAVWFFVVLLFLGSVVALAAANAVPTTRVASRTQAVDANALKPAECAALNLADVIACPPAGGNCSGTALNDLILGSPYRDVIDGRKGIADCILGAGGDDDISKAGKGSVCIGGPGNDTFDKTCAVQIQ